MRNRIVILIITGIIMIWGCLSMLRNDIDIFPDLNAPTIAIMTEAPGMTTEEIERTVTYPIETTMNGASDVRRVRSSSSSGFSIVWVEFDWDTDPFMARQIVSEKLSAISSELPPSAGTPVMGPQSSILGEMMIIGLTSSTDTTSMMQLRTIADRIIAPRILALGGVSQVSVLGGDVAEYQILLNPDKMKFHNVTLQEVKDAVNDMNMNTSGGIIYDYGNEYLVKTDIHTSSVEEISQSVVKSDINGPVRLSDISRIIVGGESPVLGKASLNTHEAVLLTITKQHGASTIGLTDKIDDLIESLAPALPSDVKISTEIFRQKDFISTSINNLQWSLIEGAVFVVIVLFIFLMNFRTTLISIIAIPLSIIVTVLILNLLDMTINTMVLGGIAIAIGSLVDDAIVDVENVYRRLRSNSNLPPTKRKSTIKIVFEASREVRLPILNSTLIIAASFLPLFFLSGMEGRLLVPLGLAFLTALSASTIVALAVTPVLCSFLLSGEKNLGDTTRDPWLSRKLSHFYRITLQSALCHKKKVLVLTSVIFVFAIIVSFTLGRGFLPPFNEGSLTINISTIPGISLDESDKLGREAEKIILSVPEIKTVARKTGRAELDEHSLDANMSEIEAPYALADRTREEMVSELREKLSHLPGTSVEIGQPISHRIDAMLSGTESQIAVKIFGDDMETLRSLALETSRVMSGIDGVVDVNVEQQFERPEIVIRPRRELLANYGLTNDRFASSIETLLAGERVSQVYSDGIQYDIVLKLDPSHRNGINDLSDMMIDTESGKIPLGVVAEIISTTGPNTVNRENVKRRIVVSANISGSDLRGYVEKIKSEINKTVKIPEGYYINYSGQFENEAEASRTLAIASFGALLLIFIMLMHEYHNLSQSLVILSNMPLALIGGILILFFSGRDINIPAIIGFISLMGIATRGGMLLMSRYNALQKKGICLSDRIIDGSLERLNPIIMTALTSAFALIPLAVRANDPGNEIQSPMALVILGGLVSSTILNLYVVPILYSYISKNKQ